MPPRPSEYQHLLGNIKKIIEDAAKQGIDITKRDELLSCRNCGAYEDVTLDGRHIICDKKNRELNEDEFILIDSRERSYHRGGITYFKTTYNFICSSCGAQQEVSVRERFED